jgi:putative transposase
MTGLLHGCISWYRLIVGVNRVIAFVSVQAASSISSWLPGKGTEPLPVAPGSPWENGFIESFHSRFRDEFLEMEEFASAPDAKEKGEWFRREYNSVRPHSSLEYQTPKEFSDECDRGLHGQPAKDKKSISDP